MAQFDAPQGTAFAPIPPPVRDVLLLEPDPILAEALSASFLRAGRRTRVARSIADLRRAMRERLPGVLVTEALVGDGDIRAVLSELRRLDLTAALPILALLPEGLGRLRRDFLAHGADAVFAHPFDPEDVARAVAAELRRSPRLSSSPGVDPLTGLLNRGGLLRAWDDEVARSGFGGPVALLEVEGIETVRRAVGWDGTDRAAIQIAALLESALGMEALLGRWASLRFVALASPGRGAGLEDALEAAVHQLSNHRFRSLEGICYQIRVQGALVTDPPVQLDRTLAQAERLLGRAMGAPATLPSPRALLVSADPRTRILVEDRFHRLDLPLEVQGALDLSSLATAPPPLIILDGTPEGGVSPDIIREVRDALPAAARGVPDPSAAQDSAGVPVGSPIALLWLSSAGELEPVIRAFALGVDDVLLTPFSPAELEMRVHRLLP
jgi:DNA-binding response OmpR family regulator